MKKKIVGWSVVLALAAGVTFLYAFVPAVRSAVASLGFGEAQENTTYWCPMHPEIVRKRPGACPV